MRRAALAALVFFAGCTEQSVELFDGSVSTPDSATGLSSRDPENCGDTETECEDDEYCIAGSCVCRPPLSLVGEDCVDTNANGQHCGGADRSCPLCVDGSCGTSCAVGMEICEEGCVDTQSDPLHCGECGRPCGSNQVCVVGLCEPFVPAPCSSCPCACARACCAYPGRPTDTICVDAAACPPG